MVNINRVLLLSSALACVAMASGAVAQSRQPVLSPMPAQPSAASIAIVAACKDVVTAEFAILQKALQASSAAVARWQPLVAMVDASAKPDEIFAKAQSLGLAQADVDKLKDLKEPAKIREHAVAEIDKLKPEGIAAAFKKQVDATCSSILEGINAQFKVAAAQARAEIETVICRQKPDALAVYLDQKYGEPSLPVSKATPGPHDLAIVSAQFGEFSERLVCDAWPYVRKKCEEGRDKKDTGASYCLINRGTEGIGDYCGYDPSPRGEKHLIVKYTCGGREQRPLRVRADTKYIRLMCRYPDPPEEGKLTPEQIAQLKKFLTDPPCAVEKLD